MAANFLRGRAGAHSAREWRVLLGVDTFLAALALYSLIVNLRVLAGIALTFAIPIAFLSGYCYRQAVIDQERRPGLRWLWLEEDIRDDDNRQPDSNPSGDSP